jgi:Protein of unknown function (DUF3108)
MHPAIYNCRSVTSTRDSLKIAAMTRANFRVPHACAAIFAASAPLACMLILFLGISPAPRAPLNFGAALSGMAQTRGKRKAPAVPAPSHAAQEAVVPFHSGERLSYRVLWSKYAVNAATIEFQAVERGNFFGHAAWHFRALAHTVDTMRFVYPLDDQFDSYTEAAQLTSVEYEMSLHEQGKQQNNAWRMIVDGGPAPSDATAAQVVPGTRDPIGLVYALRATDWNKTPELRVPVFDGHRLYNIVAHLEEPSSGVMVSAGQFVASRVAVRIFEHGQELTDMHFSVWIAQDAPRTPVLISADIPIGTARVELVSKVQP